MGSYFRVTRQYEIDGFIGMIPEIEKTGDAYVRRHGMKETKLVTRRTNHRSLAVNSIYHDGGTCIRMWKPMGCIALQVLAS